MREGIHPKYKELEARCACGNTFKTRSTKAELRLEICSACHPFFTGRQKLVDTEGRIERFTKKYGVQTSAQRIKAAKAAKAKKPATKTKKVKRKSISTKSTAARKTTSTATKKTTKSKKPASETSKTS